MHPTGPKSFDVFELDHGDAAVHAPDEVSAGSSKPHPRLDRVSARWRRVSRADRRAVAVTAIALAVAGVAVTQAVQADPPTHHHTKTHVIAAPVLAVDALGCPRGRQCVTVESPAPVLNAGHEALPSARVTYAMTERDRTSGAVYRIVLDLSATHTTIHVVSVCVPGGAPVTNQSMAATLDPTGTTIAQDLPTPAGRKQWTITRANYTPGDESCGINVIAESTLTLGIAGQSIDTVVDLLSEDPSLMASM